MNMRRLSYLLFSAFVCLSVLFSDLHTVFALDKPMIAEHYQYVNGNYKLIHRVDDFVDYGNSMGVMELECVHYPIWLQVYDIFRLKNSDGSPIFKKGQSVTMTIAEIPNYMSIISKSEGAIKTIDFSAFGIDGFHINGYNKNGDMLLIQIDDYNISSSGGLVTISFDIPSINYDVYQIDFEYHYNMDAYPGYEAYAGNNNYKFYRYGGFMGTYIKSKVYTPTDVTEKIEESNNLLENVINWIKSVRDNIVNLPNNLKGFFDDLGIGISNLGSNIVSKLQSVLDGIKNKLSLVGETLVDALENLGNFIIDGIKGLFVPSAQDLADSKDKWVNLLADRFGALYEVVQLVIDYANSFNSTASVSVVDGGGSVITIPTITINLAGSDFNFGGWEVDVVPKGFEFFFDTIKLMVSVSATILFVNGLKNKFERLVTR